MASLREAQERYARHYLALAERAEPHLTGTEQEEWLARLELEHNNLRAALRWAQESGERQVGLQLAGAVWPFWSVRGYLSEGRSWLEGLLVLVGAQETPRVPPAVQAKARTGAGDLAYRQGDNTRATALHEESLTLRRELGDRRGIATSLGSLGIVAWAQGDLVRATALYEESLALHRGLSDKHGIAASLTNLGGVAWAQGDYGRATALHEESVALLRELGDKRGIANLLGNLGGVAQEQGDLARATVLYEESLALARELGDKRGIAASLGNLGGVAHEQGDFVRATVLQEESLTLKHELGDKRGIANSLNGLGNVAHEQGDDARAMVLFEESLALAHELGDTRGIAYCLEGLARVASAPNAAPEGLARAARLFGAAAALRAAIGAPLPPNERVAYDRTVATARTALGDAAFEAAWAEGQSLTLEHAVALALGEPSPA